MFRNTFSKAVVSIISFLLITLTPFLLQAAVIPPCPCWVTLSGSVTIRNFNYPCASAFVHALNINNPVSARSFADYEAAYGIVNPIDGGTCIVTDANGIYTYSGVEIPALVFTLGNLDVNWVISIFGANIRFRNMGVDCFTFANHIPGAAPIYMTNVEVWATDVL
jgi:hypothetical protein